MQNSVAVGTAERELSPSRMLYPWELFSPHWVVPSICIEYSALYYCPYPSVVPCPHRCDESRAMARRRHASLAAGMLRIQYAWCSPFVVWKFVLLLQPFVAQDQLVHYFFQHFLLMCRHQCACRSIMYHDAPVNPSAVCRLQELCD